MCHRPAVLAVVACLSAGLVTTACHTGAPAADAPLVVVSVRVQVAGAAPAEGVERDAVVPVERALAGLPMLMHTDSVAVADAALVRLTFSGGAAHAEAAVRERLPAAGLPASVTAEVVPAAPAVLRIDFSSQTLPMVNVRDDVEELIPRRLAQTPGVMATDMCGIGRPEIVVRADPQALAGLGLGVRDLEAALAKGSPFAAPDDVRQLVVLYVNGAPVKLTDLASIEDSASPIDCWAVGADGVRRVEATISARDPAALVAVARRFEGLRNDLSAGVTIEVQPATITRSVALVPMSVVETAHLLGQLARALQPAGMVALRLDRSANALPFLPDELQILIPAPATPDTLAAIDQALVLSGLGPAHDRGRELRLTLVGDDLEQLAAAAEVVRKAGSKLADVAAVGVVGTQAAPRLEVVIDRPALAPLQLDAAEVEEILDVARHGRKVGVVRGGGESSYDVVLRLGREGSGEDPEVLRQLMVGAKLVPLSAIASLSMVMTRRSVLRHDGHHAVVVWFQPARTVPREWRTTVMNVVQALPMPAGVSAEWSK